MSTNSFLYRKYEIFWLNRVYFKQGSRQSRQKKINSLLTTAWPTTKILLELPLIVQTRPPPRIISIEGKMEEHNNILEQVNIRKISVQDKINMEERNNILEKLNRPSSWNRCVLKNASEHLKRDRKTVMAAVRQDGNAIQFTSEYLQRDREIVMDAVKEDGNALQYT